MKISNFLFIFLLISSSTLLNGQVTPVLTGLSGPWGITVHNDILYVGENTADRIIKADLTEENIMSDVYITGLTGASSLYTVDDVLYIGERNANQISTYPTTDPGGESQFCTALAFPPVGLSYRNGSLYVAEREGNKVSRTNIQNGCGAAFNTVVGDISQAYGIAISGDLLYTSDADGGFVFSINLTDKQPVKDTILAGLSTPAGLLYLNDELYIAEFGQDRVTIVSNIGENQTVSSVSCGDGPLALAADSGNNVYVTEFSANRVSRLGQEVINDTDDLNSETTINLYPNPAQKMLYIESATSFENFRIVNRLGKVVSQGTISNDNTINIDLLNPGNYYLQLDKDNIIEFVKS